MALRPALRPGAPLLRRDATHLQVGTSPGVVVADRPGLVPLLRLLDGVRDVDRLEQITSTQIPELGPDLRSILNELLACGAVVDASARRRPRRSAHAVGFEADPAAAQVVDATRAVLKASGVSHVHSTEPDVLVIAACGEPARARFERAALLGVPHLPVVIDEDRVRIGPLVRPGLTPCVSCHDLHRTLWDRAWPALLLQLGQPGTVVGPDAADPTTLHAAAIEIAVDVLRHLDGHPARTVGHCLQIGPGHDERVWRAVPFHPSCSCDLLRAA